MLKTASVAMAVCNGGEYLVAQIESILAQLSNEDELVISYDPSADDTLAIVSRYAAEDGRVRVLKNKNPGIVGNFNNALSSCTKDAVFISDQDDIWLPGKRDAVLAALNESGADLAIHNVVHIDCEGAVISKPLFEEYGIHAGLLRNFVMPRYSGCCMAFPAAARNLILPMPESVINYDHWIGMVCEVFGKVTFLDEVLLEHRLHGSNATTPRRPLPVILHQRFNLFIELLKRRAFL